MYPFSMRPYLPRTLEKAVKEAGKQFPVVTLTGPRQTGKSTLLERAFPSHRVVTLDDPAKLALAQRDPALFMDSFPPPCLIDEIQRAPGLLPYVKMAVDGDRDRAGQYLLTGSQVFPLMAGLSESLAGRTAVFELLGLSWEERGLPMGLTVDKCFEKMFTGFYPDPAVHGVNPRTYYTGYLTTYLERDIRQIRSVQDLTLFREFLELLAARVGSPLNLNDLGRLAGISFHTAKQWLSLLETSRLVYLLRPYSKNITKRVTRSPKPYFTDTGLLAHLLKYPTPDTLRAGPLAGLFFESLVVVELLKEKLHRSAAFDLYYYRDSNGNEADVVIEGAGDLALVVEIKMSKTPREEWAGALSRLDPRLQRHPAVVAGFFDEEIPLGKNIRTLRWENLPRLARSLEGMEEAGR